MNQPTTPRCGPGGCGCAAGTSPATASGTATTTAATATTASGAGATAATATTTSGAAGGPDVLAAVAAGDTLEANAGGLQAPPAGSLDHGAFDVFNPPSAALLADCVHCGFCLPACPTYQLWGDEADSPRGRIYLMKDGLEGEPMDAKMVEHIDACLGCMACVTACPSGVRYDKLIESTRQQVERRGAGHRTPWQRAVRAAIFQLFPYPRRLRAISGPLKLYQRTGLSRFVRAGLERISPTLATMEAIAPPVAAPVRIEGYLPARDASGTRLPARARVGMLLGCVQRAFYPGVNAATVRVLNMEGCDVIVPAEQGCCGALSVHAGREAEGKRFARALVDTFTAEQVDHIVVNSAGCGSTMKEYADMLADDPAYAAKAAALAAKVRDVTEILVELGPAAARHPVAEAELPVAYHDACHLSHAQGVRTPPRQLLEGIPGVRLTAIRDAETCCGSAGIYNLVNPEPARELGARKAANIADTGAELLVTGNPGCLLQITDALTRTGRDPIPTAHTIELLDVSLRGGSVRELTQR